MELKEAKQCAEIARIYLLVHTKTTDYPPIQKDEALVCLVDWIIELETMLKREAIDG